MKPKQCDICTEPGWESDTPAVATHRAHAEPSDWAGANGGVDNPCTLHICADHLAELPAATQARAEVLA